MFKKIRGYNYEVSDTGEVRNMKTERILKNYSYEKDSYLQVNLCKNGKVKNCYVHRLVLETFVGTCPEGMEACHNNGNAGDNRVKNLRWDTRKNNIKDSIDQGTRFIQRGSKHSMSKLTEEQVREIRAKYIRYNRDVNTYTLAKEYGVSNQEISNIVNNKRWKSIK